MRRMFAATAAALLTGRNSLALGFRGGGVLSLPALDHRKAPKETCWTALSRKDFPAPSPTARTTPSRPWKSLTTMPIFHFPRLRSASWIRTRSPSLTFISLVLCLSLRDFRYSPLHRFHRTSLHRHPILLCFRLGQVFVDRTS